MQGADVALFLVSPVWVPGAIAVYPFSTYEEPQPLEPGYAVVRQQSNTTHLVAGAAVSAVTAGMAYAWGGKKGLLIYAGVTYLLGGGILAAVESL